MLRNFKEVGFYDVTEIKHKLSLLPDSAWDWDERPGQVNHDVDQIPLSWCFDMHSNYTLHRYKEYEYWPIFKDTVRYVELLTGKKALRSIFTKLKPYGIIPEHVDCGRLLETVSRTHLVVQTNDNVNFIVDGERVPFEEGKIIIINNQKKHRVENNSDQPRIHLLMDLL